MDYVMTALPLHARMVRWMVILGHVVPVVVGGIIGLLTGR